MQIPSEKLKRLLDGPFGKRTDLAPQLAEEVLELRDERDRHVHTRATEIMRLEAENATLREQDR